MRLEPATSEATEQPIRGEPTDLLLLLTPLLLLVDLLDARIRDISEERLAVQEACVIARVPAAWSSMA
jgi:hypothetical protein